jgi:hypothetical protein
MSSSHSSVHPFRERLWRLLMLALYRSGRQADALAAYRRARDLLSEQLGVEPGDELRQVQAVERTANPLTELAYMFGADRYNDRFWEETLANLARSVGVTEPSVQTEKVCVDRRRQWRYIGNVRFSPAVSMVVGVVTAPVRWLRRSRVVS